MKKLSKKLERIFDGVAVTGFISPKKATYRVKCGAKKTCRVDFKYSAETDNGYALVSFPDDQVFTLDKAGRTHDITTGPKYRSSSRAKNTRTQAEQALRGALTTILHERKRR